MSDRFAELKASADPRELSDVIVRAGGRRYRLTPLAVKCTYPVFRGEAEGASSVFVKIATADEWRRTVRALKEVGSSGFFARFVFAEPIAYRGFTVFVMEWRETTIVRPEDMTEVEGANFVRECVRLSDSLQRVTDVPSAQDLPIAPERLYEELAQYAARHPVAAKLVRGLVDLPVEKRTFGSRQLAVVHGDFHTKNFGFLEDGRMSVCDVDKMMRGLACGDLANALVERFSCLGLSKEARNRLASATRRLVAQAPWPREDFEIACNVLRLEFAVRRIRKHPDAAWVAIDIARRDRKIRALLDCLEEAGAPHSLCNAPLAVAANAVGKGLPTLPCPTAHQPPTTNHQPPTTKVWLFALAYWLAVSVLASCLYPVSIFDAVNRYAPMADAFARGDWQYAFHPRFGILFQILTGSLAWATGLSGLHCLQPVAFLFLALSGVTMFFVARRLMKSEAIAWWAFALTLLEPVFFINALDGVRDPGKCLVFALIGYAAVARRSAPFALALFVYISLFTYGFAVSSAFLGLWVLWFARRREWKMLPLPFLGWVLGALPVTILTHAYTGHWLPAPQMIDLFGRWL